MRSEDPEPHRCTHCGNELDSRVLAVLDPAGAPKLSPEEWEARHRADMLDAGQIPTVADYRKVYDNLAERHGHPRPTDEEIRRTHLVAP